MFPTITSLDDSSYELNIYVKKAKEFKIDVGGHISSRPVNTGYLGLTYQTVGQVMTKTHLETYFGKFYGSAKADFTLDLPMVYPISTKFYFTMNRWDYFRSFATFFEDVQPSFLIQNEVYGGIELNLPITNTIESSLDAKVYNLDDRYYQTEDFTNKDTTDRTTFNGMSYAWSIQQNSLNRKQFANSGHYFNLTARLIAGREHSVSGSTAIVDYDIIKNHEWFNLGLEFQSFIVDTDPYHLGIHGQVVFSGQTLFSNFTASTLAMTEFSLIPDAKSYFMQEYRSPQFAGIGMNHVFTIRNNIDLRLDGYLYQPFLQVVLLDNGNQAYSKPFDGGTYMASASAIYHSFIGPIRLTANYFPKQEFPFAFQFSMGYILFNDRAIR
jgi:NTE family protein